MRIIFVNDNGASKSCHGLVFLSWAVVLVCIVAGASFVHNWYKPDLSAYGLQRMKDELSVQQAELIEIEQNAN